MVTETEYKGLAAAFEFFNVQLFGDCLPECLITLQRKKGARGYYSAKRFRGRQAQGETPALDEIALNPGAFDDRTDKQILSTLAHEMVHLWQAHFGKPGRGRYHNGQWADKMVEIGLMPTDTGAEGGKRTGQAVTHFIIAGGLFDLAADNLITGGFRINWESLEIPTLKNNSNRSKFVCPDCQAAAWGKPDLKLICGECDQPMMEQ